MKAAPRAIHQFTPSLSWGDAIGNYLRDLRGIFRGWGYSSEIFCGQTDEASRSDGLPAKSYPDYADARSVLLIHHSIESFFVPTLRRAAGRKALVYHNITPAHFFAPYHRDTARACEEGRRELYQFAPLVERAYGVSRFNAEELAASGFPNVDTLPITVDWEAFDAVPDRALLARLLDGCTNIFYVGRAAPNKRLEETLRVFAAYQRLYNPNSRLMLAGGFDARGAYGRRLSSLIQELGVLNVELLGRLAAPKLSACFEAADIYLSMSAHEGLCVPLLEAMHRGVPVVAFAGAAVPETLAGAGVCFHDDDPLHVAKLLSVIERREDFRERIIRLQHERAKQCSRERLLEEVRMKLSPLLEAQTGEKPRRTASRSEWLVVAPGFATAPEQPLSRAAFELGRALAARVPTRLLTLAPSPIVGVAPESSMTDGLEVVRHTPEARLRDRRGPYPFSSSLESAVRSSHGPVILVGEHEPLTQTLLNGVEERIRGVIVSPGAEEPLPSLEVACFQAPKELNRGWAESLLEKLLPSSKKEARPLAS